MAKINSLVYISDSLPYEDSLSISHSKLHLKSKINTGTNLIVNTTYIPTKYFDIIKDNAITVTLSDLDYLKYKYQPKKYCYERLNNIELWSLLLRLNNMTSIAEFTKKTFKIPPTDINRLLNEMLIMEEKAINKNRMSIE